MYDFDMLFLSKCLLLQVYIAIAYFPYILHEYVVESMLPPS
jgi:hypothetical protein